MRRPEVAARGPVALTISPHDQQGDLPSWSPPIPVGGWSPGAVFAAAVEYSLEEGADAALLNARRALLAAERGLFAALPLVKQAHIVERLQGIDRHRAYFGDTRRTPAPSTSEAAPDDVDDAPF